MHEHRENVEIEFSNPVFQTRNSHGLRLEKIRGELNSRIEELQNFTKSILARTKRPMYVNFALTIS